jgi:hypothetical protein
VLKASEFIAVVRWAEAAVLVTVVVGFLAVFVCSMRRLSIMRHNIIQWFKFKKSRLPTEVNRAPKI